MNFFSFNLIIKINKLEKMAFWERILSRSIEIVQVVSKKLCLACVAVAEEL